ncbi:MAG: NTP transferase domain-containing protein [Pirellulales bacterium]|nr:NTP transferase domain-containing protein [Pirellulales bacterium]
MSDRNSGKIVILARGLGTRMRRDDASAEIDGRQAAMADTGVKAMIPIGRPFLDYVLSAAADAGYRQACLVVGPEQESMRSYYREEVSPKRIAVSFANQAKPKGTADAVAAAEDFAAGDHFAVINSDNYYPLEALRGLREQPGCAVALFERDAMLAGNVTEERISRLAVARIDERENLAEIIEKPDDKTLAVLPRPLWLSMNCWRFGPSIFEACRAIKPSPRGEFEIPDAVEHAMHELAEPFRALKVRMPVLDMTSRADIASMSKLLAEVKVSL